MAHRDAITRALQHGLAIWITPQGNIKLEGDYIDPESTRFQLTEEGRTKLAEHELHIIEPVDRIEFQSIVVPINESQQEEKLEETLDDDSNEPLFVSLPRGHEEGYRNELTSTIERLAQALLLPEEAIGSQDCTNYTGPFNPLWSNGDGPTYPDSTPAADSDEGYYDIRDENLLAMLLFMYLELKKPRDQRSDWSRFEKRKMKFDVVKRWNEVKLDFRIAEEDLKYAREELCTMRQVIDIAKRMMPRTQRKRLRRLVKM